MNYAIEQMLNGLKNHSNSSKLKAFINSTETKCIKQIYRRI